MGLKAHVFLSNPDTFEVESFGPDSKLPAWAKDKLKDAKHLFEDIDDGLHAVELPAPKDVKSGEVVYTQTGDPQGKEPAATENGTPQGGDQGEGDEGDGDEGDEGDDMPKDGASAAVWKAFAEELDDPIEVPETLEGRNDIRDHIKAKVAERKSAADQA